MAYTCRTKSITFEAPTCFALWLAEREILLLGRACLALWLTLRGIYDLYQSSGAATIHTDHTDCTNRNTLRNDVTDVIM